MVGPEVRTLLTNTYSCQPSTVVVTPLKSGKCLVLWSAAHARRSANVVLMLVQRRWRHQNDIGWTYCIASYMYLHVSKYMYLINVPNVPNQDCKSRWFNHVNVVSFRWFIVLKQDNVYSALIFWKLERRKRKIDSCSLNHICEYRAKRTPWCCKNHGPLARVLSTMQKWQRITLQ